MKELCDKCNTKAVWYYMPDDRPRRTRPRFYCEDHVPSRGCSCNIYGDITECPKDAQGREYPCCEYMYAEEGFDDDP